MNAPEQELKSLSISLFDTINPDVSKPIEQPSILGIIKQACKDKKFDCLAYIVKSLKYIPIEPIDEFGNTILHFIVSNIDQLGGITFLQEILSYPNIDKIINKLSEKDGITPVFLATTLKRFDIVNELVSHGADIKIKSRSGAFLVTEVETEKPKEESKSVTSTGYDYLSKFLAPLMNIRKSEEVPIQTLNLSEVQPKKEEKVEQVIPEQDELKTTEFIKEVIKNNTKQPIVEEQPKAGGSSNVVVGQRLLNNVPDFSSISGGKSEKQPKKKGFELARIVDDIHSRTIETIKSVMDVDEPTAKLYKSVLYYRVKKEHPEFSGYQRAVEMEKLATKEILKDIDIEKEKKEREESPKEEKKEKKEQKGKKEKKQKKSKKESESESSSEETPKKKSSLKKKSAPSESSSETSSPDLDTNLSI